jgi:cytidylate kinase
MGSPKSRVRVSREFEREGEAMDAVREKCQEREREARHGLAEPKSTTTGGGEERRC